MSPIRWTACCVASLSLLRSAPAMRRPVVSPHAVSPLVVWMCQIGVSKALVLHHIQQATLTALILVGVVFAVWDSRGLAAMAAEMAVARCSRKSRSGRWLLQELLRGISCIMQPGW